MHKQLKQRRRHKTIFGWAALLTLISSVATADKIELPPHTSPARISIIIDDLGDKFADGLRSVKLPGAVTLSFLPHSPYSRSLASSAYRDNKEIMIHLPMQPMKRLTLSRGGLTLDMDRLAFNRSLRASIAAVPHAVGINNHMGSLLTRHPGHMQWLMDELKNNTRLYFIDSRTTHHTVAQRVAEENKIPTMRRDVFLDNDPSPAAIAHQFKRLLKKARKNGSAIAIGHPYSSTLSFLEEKLPQLARNGIQLVAVSQLFNNPTPKQRLARPEQTPDHLVFYQAPNQQYKPE